MPWPLILLLASLILAILAALQIPSNRIGLFPASFACFIGYMIITHEMVG